MQIFAETSTSLATPRSAFPEGIYHFRLRFTIYDHNAVSSSHDTSDAILD